MKNRSPVAPTRRLGKQLFESGQQCLKRLYLDVHEPVEEEADEERQAMSAAGQRLLQLARSAFPRSTEISEADLEAAAAKTRQLLAQESTMVLFGAAFVTDELETVTDIVLRQKDGRLDVYEVKSGTRVTMRYLVDLARQLLTIEGAGLQVRSVFVLHVNPAFKQQDDNEPAPDKLFKSADVTDRVRRLLPRVTEQLREFRQQPKDNSVLQLPTGTFCTRPFTCPYLAGCSQHEPAHPLRSLPDLTRKLEGALHEEGVADLLQIDPKRPGLSFRQRRTLQCLHQEETIVEPFVRDELRHVEFPLHFLALIEVTDVLPRFAEQPAWRPVPHGFAVVTLQQDGQTSEKSLVLVDKGDPRGLWVEALAEAVAQGGTFLCWNAAIDEMAEALVTDLQSKKAAARIVLAHTEDMLDIANLFGSGVFAPALVKDRSLVSTVKVLLDDDSALTLPIHTHKAAAAALRRALAPRVRAATKEKVAADLQAWLSWRAHAQLRLFQRFAELPTAAAVSAPEPKRPAPRRLPAPE